MDRDINYRAKNSGKHRIFHFSSLNSTNDAMEWLSKEGKMTHGDVVLADHQTEGRGMRGNSWQSESGKNLLFSLYLELSNLLAEEQFYISKLVSICLWESLQTICTDHNVKIKWPNDILMNNKKLAGILIQLSLRNNKVQNAIVGIGINVHQTLFSEHFQATSIFNETKKTIALSSLLDLFLNAFDERLHLLREKNWKEIDALYHSKLWSLNEFREYSDKENRFQACLCEVGRDGRAEFEFRNGERRHYAIKEISPA